MSLNHRSRIPVTLVTGFLGSGKTTLINAGLKSPDLAKTVVVVNEFGEVGLDHQLYTSSNDAVVVLENGCLCCTVRTDLIATMNSLYHDRARGDLPDFNNVVIETTGLAEPGPVLQAFLSEPTLDGLYCVVNVVTVVDAVNWEATAQNHDEALRQVALADDILISKLNMNGERNFAELSAQLQAMNQVAKIAKVDLRSEAVAPLLMHKGFDAADSRADPTEWLSISSYEAYAQKIAEADGVKDQGVPSHLAAKAIESFVLTRSNPLSREELQFLLDGIGQPIRFQRHRQAPFSSSGLHLQRQQTGRRRRHGRHRHSGLFAERGHLFVESKCHDGVEHIWRHDPLQTRRHRADLVLGDDLHRSHHDLVDHDDQSDRLQVRP